MQELLKVTHEEREHTDSIAYSLQAKANAFCKTGNEQMGNYLGDIASSLLESGKRISDAVGQDLSREVKLADERLANVAKAAIVGAAMVTKDKGKRRTLKRLHKAIR